MSHVKISQTKVIKLKSENGTDRVTLFDPVLNVGVSKDTGVKGCGLKKDDRPELVKTFPEGRFLGITAVACYVCRFADISIQEGGCRLVYRIES